jgi:hypothetical protein
MNISNSIKMAAALILPLLMGLACARREEPAASTGAARNERGLAALERIEIEDVPVPVRAFGVKLAGDYREALDIAKRDARDLAVLVHGSDWCRPGEFFKRNVWDQPDFRAVLGDGFVLYNVDVPENPDEVRRKDFAERNKGFNANFPGYPVLMMIDPAGRRTRSVYGGGMPDDLETAAEWIRAARRAREERDHWLAQAEQGDPDYRLEMLARARHCDAGLQKEIVERLAKLDPDDMHGYLASFKFNHAAVLKRAQDLARGGKAGEALDWLRALLENDKLSTLQQQWVLTAMGQAYRFTDGKRRESFEAFMRAHALDPASVPGVAAKRLAFRFVNIYELIHEWNPAKVSTSPHTWEIAAAAVVKQPGEYEVEFDYQRGRSGISIKSVRLKDGEELIAEDVHDGFSGSRDSANRYRLKVAQTPSSPLLEAVISTGPDTDSYGRMIFRRVN